MVIDVAGRAPLASGATVARIGPLAVPKWMATGVFPSATALKLDPLTVMFDPAGPLAALRLSAARLVQAKPAITPIVAAAPATPAPRPTFPRTRIRLTL